MKWLDWLALWVFTFGVWPLSDPGHSGHSLMSVLDLLLHLTAAVVLVSRWQIVRRPARTPPRTEVDR